MGCKAGQRLETSCAFGWIKFAIIGLIVSAFVQGSFCDTEPTESQCRPYIEKALKEQHIEAEEKIFEGPINKELYAEQEEFSPTDELTDSTESSITKDDGSEDDDDDNEDEAEVNRKDEGDEDEDVNAEEENDDTDKDEDIRVDEEAGDGEEENVEEKDESLENGASETGENEANQDGDDDDDGKEDDNMGESLQNDSEQVVEAVSGERSEEKDDIANFLDDLKRRIEIEIHDVEMDDDDDDGDKDDNKDDEKEEGNDDQKSEEVRDEDEKEDKEEKEEGEKDEEEKDEDEEEKDEEKADEEKVEENDDNVAEKTDDKKDDDDQDESDDDKIENKIPEVETEDEDETKAKDDEEGGTDEGDEEKKSDEDVDEQIEKTEAKKLGVDEAAENEKAEEDTNEAPEEEELIKEVVIPENLRPRNHIEKILRLEDSAMETLLEKTIDVTLKALKTLYDNAIKPLEILYKYRDLSNRHFGDPEIFSKPLILFMGPWSGGKSSTINYLLDNEFSHSSLRTGAEPSPAYFNILMHGEEEEVLDGTQLAADWTFSGLQKFGQSLLDRLKGIKMPNKLLEKVNIVEIPGILEIRKQVQRLFPFNDACQWFIDRADIIFLVYDPSKLDVGPETEAILDQLKGREYQTRIILNKADQVKPEELMRVQGTLIWNISPLMSSSEPPIMYSTSLWSLPYEVGAPIRLLQAQERAFLKDLREAIDKRVENKIASARRFAVRVRNHAKMVDCYLTTYYNHKTIFGNRKKISDDITEYPQKYHIYEGLSTLTNISRYDLPDPEAYKDFFKINPLYEFKKLSETCTYFRGCPINKLDVAIAYDLPELVGKYKKAVETAKEQLPKENS